MLIFYKQVLIFYKHVLIFYKHVLIFFKHYKFHFKHVPIFLKHVLIFLKHVHILLKPHTTLFFCILGSEAVISAATTWIPSFLCSYISLVQLHLELQIHMEIWKCRYIWKLQIHLANADIFGNKNSCFADTFHNTDTFSFSADMRAYYFDVLIFCIEMNLCLFFNMLIFDTELSLCLFFDVLTFHIEINLRLFFSQTYAYFFNVLIFHIESNLCLFFNVLIFIYAHFPYRNKLMLIFSMCLFSI